MIFPTDYWNNVTVYGAYSDQNLKKYEKMFPEEMIQAIKKNPDLETLSGGEKQIVCILRVLCSNKEFIIMDEPFSAMNQVCIEKFIKSISSIKKTMIITAHNLNEYFDSFDVTALLKCPESDLLRCPETAHLRVSGMCS